MRKVEEKRLYSSAMDIADTDVGKMTEALKWQHISYGSKLHTKWSVLWELFARVFMKIRMGFSLVHDIPLDKSSS